MRQALDLATPRERPGPDGSRAEAVADGALNAYRFSPSWLPGLAPESVDTSTTCFGLRLPAPVVLDGAVPGAAEVAGSLGLPLLVGLESLEHLRPAGLADPPAVLIVETPAAGALSRPGRVLRALGEVRPAALLLQVDLLRDADATTGSSALAGLLKRLTEFARAVELPVLVEEIGFGLSPAAVERLLEAGASGAVLTGHGRARGWRLERTDFHPAPFAETLRRARQTSPGAVLLAADGAEDGTDIAKELALGADLVLLASAPGSADHVTRRLDGLKATMCQAGTDSLSRLRAAGVSRRPVAGPFRTYSEHLGYATSGGGCEFVDVTSDVEAVVTRSGVEEGLVQVFAQHTTAAIRVNENEPLLHGDVRRLLSELAPVGGYEHDDMTRRSGVPPDEPVNGHSHCRQLLLGGGETLPVLAGRISLGRWQRIFLIELDGARTRDVTVTVMGAGA